ncbi:pteridine reductase [Marinobacter sp. 2_MG-2023]|uniref:pteridine reductase n=1 Tax=Marinobacter sp. 2_MG-2023 TaxID=3062679 RepID=UPI0026E2970B|nr:pteridine reductase [Marinobacter sp. 2_MG-2023]MDO6443074.1 pteridine reductase [Marinobacter sp. 2_MG-2023]
MPAPAPVALITGSAHRLGARTAQLLHDRGWNLVIHYRSRKEQADRFTETMNKQRENSAVAVGADLSEMADITRLGSEATAHWGRLDALVNNASVFYPNPTSEATSDDWDRIMHTNLKAPFFLLQACLPALEESSGNVVNLIDIYSEKPLPEHPLYCASKAGLAALTRSWAKDLAPRVRVNGVSPGAILWPDGEAAVDAEYQNKILDKTPMKRTGTADDIARTVVFLITEAPFITGQIISVDGGRSLNM